MYTFRWTCKFSRHFQRTIWWHLLQFKWHVIFVPRDVDVWIQKVCCSVVMRKGWKNPESLSLRDSVNYDTPRQWNVLKDNGNKVMKRIQASWSSLFSMDSLHQVSMCWNSLEWCLVRACVCVNTCAHMHAHMYVQVCVCVPESSIIIIFKSCSTYFVSCLANVNARSCRWKFLPSDAAISRRDPVSSRSFTGLPLARTQNRCTNTRALLGPGQVPHLSLFFPCGLGLEFQDVRTSSSCLPAQLCLPEAGKAHLFSFGSVSLRISELQSLVPITFQF